jgi:hypothetical protein
MKKIILSFIIAMLISVNVVYAVEIIEYKHLFNNILDNLVENYTWENNEVGNWDKDMMYDSTLFAPDILFQLSSDSDFRTEGERMKLFNLAKDTINYEMRNFIKLLIGKGELIETFAGIPSFIDAYEQTRNPVFSFILWLVTLQSYDILKKEPNPLGEYIGYYGAHGLVSYYILDFSMKENSFLSPLSRSIGLNIIDKADKYSGKTFYEDGWVLMALSHAYRISGDKKYKQEADFIILTLEKFWDREQGGYWEQSKNITLGRRKKLSTHERTARGLIHWYEVTGDKKYLDKTRDILDFTERVLCDESICYHHWTEFGHLPQECEIDPYYEDPLCTGCNFNLLIDIYLLNKAIS